jgi:flagellar protein FlaG
MSPVNPASALPPVAQPAPLLQSAGTLPARSERADQAAAAPQAPVAAPAPSALAVSGAEVAKPSREAVVQAAQHIESFVKSVGRSLDFSVDPTTGDNVLRVLNSESGEVVRQLPSEETLRIARAVDYIQSVLVNQRA